MPLSTPVEAFLIDHKERFLGDHKGAPRNLSHIAIMIVAVRTRLRRRSDSRLLAR